MMQKPVSIAPLDEELANRLLQQKLTAEFGIFCLRSSDLSTTLQEASRVCAQGLRSEFAKVLEYDTERRDFLVVAGVGWRAGVVGHARIGGGRDSPAGYAFESALPVTSNDLSEETRFRTPRLLLEHGVRGALNVIVRGDGEAFGVLEVDTAHRSDFNAADTAFLQGFANMLGAAVEAYRLRDQLRRKDALLERALAHEKVLVREVHHRAKNSLALVASVLTLQIRRSENPDLKQALSDAEARIHAVAEVHDRLATHGVSGLAPLDAFLGDLCQRIAAANPQHRLVCEIPPIPVSADQAITLGLLTNELVTNAVKYAYRNGGDVYIVIRPGDGGRYVLEVRDEGIGITQGKSERAAGLGTTVVSSLARQLGGTVEWRRAEPGTSVIVNFGLADN